MLPLQNLSGDPSQDYFADGITDELITELAQIPSLRVVSRTSVMQDKGNKKPLRQIARELDVDAVVEGSVVRSGDRVRITAQLIDARDDRDLWARSFEEQMSDILSLQDTIAGEIVAQAKAVLVPGATSTRPRLDPAAYNAYLRGLYFLNLRDMVKSAEYFQQAVSLTPKWAAAYAGLSEALATQGIEGNEKTTERVMPLALAAAQRAIELDPKSGEAYAARAHIETIYNPNWGSTPRCGACRSAQSKLRACGSGVCDLPRLDGASGGGGKPHAARPGARSPSPFSSIDISARACTSPATTRNRCITWDAPWRWSRSSSRNRELDEPRQRKAGKLSDAMDSDLKELLKAFPKENLGPLGTASNRGDWRGYQSARIALLKAHPLNVNGCIIYELGLSYLRMGDHDRAVGAIEDAANRHCFWTYLMKSDPVVDDLRGDPRYPSLLVQVGQTP